MIDAIARTTIAHLHAIGVLDASQQPPNLGTVVQQIATQFTSLMTLILSTIDSTVIVISRLAYVSILLIGVLLYFSHAERRLGKDLIKGGVVLALLSEFIFPLISKL